MPDAPRLLVEEVVHHGMEHDDTAVRLWSTLLPPRLLVRCRNEGVVLRYLWYPLPTPKRARTPAHFKLSMFHTTPYQRFETLFARE